MWDTLASEETIQKTIDALKGNGIEAFVVDSGGEAKQKVLELIPKRSEVMTMSSITLEETNLLSELNESGNFNSIKKKLSSMDRKTQGQEMNRLGAAPQFAVGSVHAVTEDGHILVASASGSQLPAYSFASPKVIFVVGTQKIVTNIDEGIKRIYDYVFPLEDARAKKAYGVGSGVNKLLIINREMFPGRLTLIFVKEKLGF